MKLINKIKTAVIITGLVISPLALTQENSQELPETFLGKMTFKCAKIPVAFKQMVEQGFVNQIIPEDVYSPMSLTGDIVKFVHKDGRFFYWLTSPEKDTMCMLAEGYKEGI